jgi:hypothetical protein
MTLKTASLASFVRKAIIFTNTTIKATPTKKHAPSLRCTGSESRLTALSIRNLPAPIEIKTIVIWTRKTEIKTTAICINRIYYVKKLKDMIIYFQLHI